MQYSEEKKILLIILLWIGTWGVINILMYRVKNFYLKVAIYFSIILFSYTYLKKLKI